MSTPRALCLAACLVLLAPAVASEDRLGLAPDGTEIHPSPGETAVLHTLQAHALYFRVLDESAQGVGWLRIESLPSVEPPYTGWVRRAGVELFDTTRDARMAYFAAHPQRDPFLAAAAVLTGAYWDLRDQSPDGVPAPGLWLRYWFDFTEWWLVRGKQYEAEVREIADIGLSEDGHLRVWIFTAALTTPPEPVEIEILSEGRIRLRQADLPARSLSRARTP